MRGTVSCPICAGPMVDVAHERTDADPHQRAAADDPHAGACLECGARLS